VIAYAKERYINIVPEIDMPGHMLGALAANPEMGCTNGPYAIWRQWDVSEDVLSIGNDKALTFINDVLTELTDLFPSTYIHVGGDECPKTSWKKCTKCQARIKELGLIFDGKHTAEERLQSYVISYAEKFSLTKVDV
jgi:hexosaminidase